MSHGLLPLLTAIVSFTLVDCFDTVGTLIGTAGNAGMLDEKGELHNGDKALIADAVATCVGACLGTSTVTTFVESRHKDRSFFFGCSSAVYLVHIYCSYF